MNKRTVLSFIASASVIAGMPLLAACASSGLYDMSDDWCARHIDASPAHCRAHDNVRAPDGGRETDSERSGIASR